VFSKLIFEEGKKGYLIGKEGFHIGNRKLKIGI
jgi:hypothetical protein